MKEFGILLFGHTRPLYIADVLLSLKKQDALKYVDVWLDGHQNNHLLKAKTDQVFKVVSNFPVNKVYKHMGHLGFRNIILQALTDAVNKYNHIMILEDDCFPTKDAVKIFKNELIGIESESEIFSIYGHPFLLENENETCTRFQGWGWGTTSEKLEPILKQLVNCYSYAEESYLSFVNSVLTPEIIKRIDITPPRLATDTLRAFFAWDETITLLTAMAGMSHKKTGERTIYNFGAGQDSTRFRNVNIYLSPPFNMIAHKDVWDYF